MQRLCLLFLLLLPAEAWAAESWPHDIWVSGFKLLLGTLIVIGLMLLIYALNRKGLSFLKDRGSNSIEILETRPVGGRKSLCLVKVRGENLLLGLGTDRVDLLFHFDSSKAEQRFDNELQERFEGKR